MRKNDQCRRCDQHAHCRKNDHRRRQRDHLPDGLFTLALAKPRKVRHVEAQGRPETDHRRQRRDKNGPKFAKCMKFSRLVEQEPDTARLIQYPAEQDAGHHKHVRRRPVLDYSQQVHALVDDRDIHRPKDQKRKPLGRRMPADRRPKQCRPTRNERRKERLQGLAADPRLNAEPAAGNECTHQRRQI